MPSADTSFAEAWIKPGEDAFRFWVSFFPTAPLFGVEWRFAPPTDASVDSCATQDMTAPEPRGETAETVLTQSTDETSMGEATDAPTMAASPVETVQGPEALAPAATQHAEPALATEAEPEEDPSEAPDDLKRIKGIGPGLEKQLNELGIFTFAQISEMDAEKLAWLDENLTTVKGRYLRDDWVGQANALMA